MGVVQGILTDVAQGHSALCKMEMGCVTAMLTVTRGMNAAVM